MIKGFFVAVLIATFIWFLKIKLNIGVLISFLIECSVVILLYIIFLFVFKSHRVIESIDLLKEKTSKFMLKKKAVFEIRSERIIHDKREKNIYFNNAGDRNYNVYKISGAN